MTNSSSVSSALSPANFLRLLFLRSPAPLCVSALSFFFLFCCTGDTACGGQKNSESQPSYRIAGKIVDATSNTSITGAELSFSEAAAEMKVTSDEQGRFLFAPLDPGKYTLQASARGYVTQDYNQHHGYSTAIAVGPGLDSEHVLFHLHRQAVITGTISDERGEPVRSARVLLFGKHRGPGKHTVLLTTMAQSNDLGVYRFSRLPAGKYFVAVSARPWYAQFGFSGRAEFQEGEGALGRSFFTSFASLPSAKSDPKLDVVYPVTFFPGVTDEHAATELVLNPGDTQQADVRLQAIASVHIRLTGLSPNQPSAPGQGVIAKLKFFDSFESSIPVASRQLSPGTFELSGLPPGEITLVLNSSRDGENESRIIHANLGDGDTVDAGISAAATVSGKVIPAGSAAAVSGMVSLAAQDGRFLAKNVGKDSTFLFPRVEPGTYDLEANLGDANDYVQELTATGAKVVDHGVMIEGTEEVHLLVRMGHGLGEIQRLVRSGDKPEAGAMVLLIPASGENLERYSRVDQSDSDGTFNLKTIVPGNYLLLALDDWDLDWQDPKALAPYRAKAQPLEISASEVRTLVVEQQKRANSPQP